MNPLVAANQLLATRRDAEALREFARLAVAHPGHPLVLLGLATAQLRLAKTEAGLANLERVRDLKIDDPVIQHNIGKTYVAETAQTREGLAILRAAHERWPGDAALRDDFIGVLSSTDASAETIRRGTEAMTKGPDSLKLRLSLAAAYVQQGHAPEGDRVLREALVKAPGDLKLLESIARGSLYNPLAGGEDVRKDHEAHAARLRALLGPVPTPPVAAPGQMTLGVLSPDFKRHSVAHFSFGLIERLIDAGWRVTCYYTAATQDEFTARFRGLRVKFVDMPWMPPQAVASRIRADGVRVLLDLAGLSASHRLGTLMLRPAPIMATYLGYAATTGAAEVQHRLVDAQTDPAGSESHTTEAVVRLPGCFVCYRVPPGTPEPGTTPREDQAFTFGSFNALLKLCDRTVALWAEVLRACPGTRLFIKTGALGEDGTRDHTRSRFEAHGIDPGRLDLRGWIDHPGHHLSLYDLVDVGLDPVTYHGTTTTCEALAMGVPVLTLRGGRHASRVGPSLLMAAGRAGDIADSPEAFVALAKAWAGRGVRGAESRLGLAAATRASALCDGGAFASGFDAVLRDLGKDAWKARGG